ncbi:MULTISPECIES: PAS domain S-box protein [unclassified Paenibacillus]|uniref:PAS domain S-box protein n=1 Tax=unclassified Paenibacillus TaxID=185978 RepID=UPI001AE32516|nr:MULTISPECIES: PAS domain S-box protein [unclassified Paenibacillus]MBP1156494.1 PAS domain S-box-containing protein [Paenibacillus sp. PvP091]MBP1168120.1 PAS domain S-box-containing protein [Paenibacillus sp. PvR098]MBP2439148.1 PAS domain S-box-containing protein [Paenibacillus sp. PvP052]
MPNKWVSIMVEKAADGICLLKWDGHHLTIEEANPAFYQIIGYTKQELWKETFLSFLSNEYRAWVLKRLEFFEYEDTLFSEACWTVKHGIQMDVELSLRETVMDGSHYYIMIVRDVSDKKWILCQGSGFDMRGTLTPKFRFVDCSFHSPLLEMKRRDLVSQSFLSFVGSRSLLQVRHMLRQAVLTGSGFSMSMEWVSNNQKAEVEFRFQPLLNGRQEVTRIAFVGRRLTKDEAQEQSKMALSLRMLMAERQITVTKLSELTGLSIGTISKIRNGKITNPHKYSIQCIAEALDVHLNDLWKE